MFASILAKTGMLTTSIWMLSHTSLPADATATNKLHYVDNDVIITKLSKGPISLQHLKFHDRIWYFFFTYLAFGFIINFYYNKF